MTKPEKRGHEGPITRANPYSEVTDLFCRLPLMSFCDLVRVFLTRVPAAEIGTASSKDHSFRHLFTGHRMNTGRSKVYCALHDRNRASRHDGIQLAAERTRRREAPRRPALVGESFKKKRQLFPDHSKASVTSLASPPDYLLQSSRILTRFPFGARENKSRPKPTQNSQS